MMKKHHNRFHCAPGCPVEATLSLIGGKWKGVIIFHLLKEKTLRFNEIRRLLPDITQRMLTNQLRELEADGILSRKIYAQVPPRVDYSMTEFGLTLEPVVRELKHWGDAYLKKTNAAPSDSTEVTAFAIGSN